MDYTNFIHNIRKIRMCEGITAKELSKRCKLKQMKRISDIEEGRGKPTLNEIISICNELGIKIDNMIYGKVKITYHWEE